MSNFPKTFSHIGISVPDLEKPAEFEYWKSGTFHFCVQDPNIEDLVE